VSDTTHIRDSYAQAIRILESVQAAIVSDCLRQLGISSHSIPGLRPLGGMKNTGASIVGPAFTISMLPRRPQARDDASRLTYGTILQSAQPGAIAVVAGHGAPYGFWGMHATRKAVKCGIRGVIVDGFGRDTVELREASISVFALGTSAEAYRPYYEVSATEDPVVLSGGVRIEANDLIVIDEDGCVVVPHQVVEDVVNELQSVQAHERELDKTFGQ
jgi:regulator of RNase E activity RraA